jgi:hypothetical protein
MSDNEIVTNELATLSNAEIIEVRKKVNEAVGANVFSTGKGKSKTVMAGEMDDLYAENAGQPIALASSEYRTIKLSEVDIHPCNMRSPVDYLDRSFDDKINLSGGLLKDPVISSRVITRPDGTTYHPIIGGNRSIVALRRVVAESWGLDPNEYTINVKVRQYKGTLHEQISQELVDLQADNDTHMKPSVIDNCKMVKHYKSLGFSGYKIAEVMGKSLSFVSYVSNFGLLPERIQRLIDVESKREHYKTLTYDEIIANNLEFDETFDSDGKAIYNLKGIIVNKAREMFTYLPSLNAAKSADFDQKLMDAHDLLESCVGPATNPEVTQKDFKRILTERAALHPGFAERAADGRRGGKADTTTAAPAQAPSEPEVQSTPPATAAPATPTEAPVLSAGAKLMEQMKSGSLNAPPAAPPAPQPAQAAKPSIPASAPATAPATNGSISNSVFNRQDPAKVGDVEDPGADDKVSEATTRKMESQFSNRCGYSIPEAIDMMMKGELRWNDEIDDVMSTDARNLEKAQLVDRLVVFMFRNGYLAFKQGSTTNDLAVALAEREPTTIRELADIIERGWIT